MFEDSQLKFELPILDIIAIFIALLTLIVALLSLYISNQTRINTSNVVNELTLGREELVKIRTILSKT